MVFDTEVRVKATYNDLITDKTNAEKYSEGVTKEVSVVLRPKDKDFIIQIADLNGKAEAALQEINVEQTDAESPINYEFTDGWGANGSVYTLDGADQVNTYFVTEDPDASIDYSKPVIVILTFAEPESAKILWHPKDGNTKDSLDTTEKARVIRFETEPKDAHFDIQVARTMEEDEVVTLESIEIYQLEGDTASGEQGISTLSADNIAIFTEETNSFISDIAEWTDDNFASDQGAVIKAEFAQKVKAKISVKADGEWVDSEVLEGKKIQAAFDSFGEEFKITVLDLKEGEKAELLNIAIANTPKKAAKAPARAEQKKEVSDSDEQKSDSEEAKTPTNAPESEEKTPAADTKKDTSDKENTSSTETGTKKDDEQKKEEDSEDGSLTEKNENKDEKEPVKSEGTAEPEKTSKPEETLKPEETKKSEDKQDSSTEGTKDKEPAAPPVKSDEPESSADANDSEDKEEKELTEKKTDASAAKKPEAEADESSKEGDAD